MERDIPLAECEELLLASSEEKLSKMRRARKGKGANMGSVSCARTRMVCSDVYSQQAQSVWSVLVQRQHIARWPLDLEANGKNRMKTRSDLLYPNGRYHDVAAAMQKSGWQLAGQSIGNSGWVESHSVSGNYTQPHTKDSFALGRT